MILTLSVRITRASTLLYPRLSDGTQHDEEHGEEEGVGGEEEERGEESWRRCTLT